MKTLRLLAVKIVWEWVMRNVKRLREDGEAGWREAGKVLERVLRGDSRTAALLLVLQSSTAAFASAEEVVSNIFRPFRDAVAVFLAIAFGIGIIGFALIIVDALLSWFTGGSFGRSLAVGKFLKAAETLAIIPIIFLSVQIMKGIGIQEVSQVADILNSLLQRGWQIVLSALSGS